MVAEEKVYYLMVAELNLKKKKKTRMLRSSSRSKDLLQTSKVKSCNFLILFN